GDPGLLNLPNRLAVAHMPPAKECNMSSSFADIGVSTTVANALRARGATAPFPIQELVIPDALAGRDVLAKSPTGSGKTLAFAVPIAEQIEASDRRRGRAPRGGVHARRAPARARAGARAAAGSRPPLPESRARGKARHARRRAARRSPRSYARVRANQARRRQACEAAEGARPRG